VADLEGMPDLESRVELHEGKLVLMAPVVLWHTRIAVRVMVLLRKQGAPADIEVGVKRSAKSMRIADVGVFYEPQSNMGQAYWRPDELAMVMELVSESSKEDDRTAKPRWYAAAGIPEYWRIEPSGDTPDAVIFRYKLAKTSSGEAAYVETGVTTLSILEAEAA
jgi:Uma2 family endonuclease